MESPSSQKGCGSGPIPGTATKSNGAKTKPTARFLGGIDIPSAAKNWKCILGNDRLGQENLVTSINSHVPMSEQRQPEILLVTAKPQTS
jgi:hypothetical protein